MTALAGSEPPGQYAGGIAKGPVLICDLTLLLSIGWTLGEKVP
jgi:hypothetical protein